MRPSTAAESTTLVDHVEDRLRGRRHPLPDADGLEQPPRRRDDRGGARIAAGAIERGIGDHDVERRPERLSQRDRERQPGEARAGNQDIGPSTTLFHGRYSHARTAS
jgi:hypothetical protein